MFIVFPLSGVRRVLNADAQQQASFAFSFLSPEYIFGSSSLGDAEAEADGEETVELSSQLAPSTELKLPKPISSNVESPKKATVVERASRVAPPAGFPKKNAVERARLAAPAELKLSNPIKKKAVERARPAAPSAGFPKKAVVKRANRVAPAELKLPVPIINVGSPKAGTTTIFNFFSAMASKVNIGTRQKD